MATSPQDAAQMVQRAEQAGLKQMVCHNLRFNPRYTAMRQAVADGKIGDIFHMYSRRNSEPEAVDHVLGRFPLACWVLPQDIDMMLWTAGSPVVEPRAYSRS